MAVEFTHFVLDHFSFHSLFLFFSVGEHMLGKLLTTDIHYQTPNRFFKHDSQEQDTI